MRLFPDDVVILALLREYRYLTSGQLSRLTGRSGQVLRRAIRRRLRPGGFVTDLHRTHPTEEAAYTLGPEGYAFIAHELGCAVADLPFSRKASRVKSYFWLHTLLVNEVRIALAVASRPPTCPIEIERVVPEWEVDPGVRRKAAHHERFILSEPFKDADGRSLPHRPDCLFLVRPRGATPERLVAVFLEADRRTESMRRIRQKCAAYLVYWRRQRFAAFGAVGMRVLFVLGNIRGDQRVRSMQEELARFTDALRDDAKARAFRGCFRFAQAHALTSETVLTQPIWFDADNQPRLFFQPVRPLEEHIEEAAQ